MQTRKLTTCNNPVEAHLLQGRLEAAGIDSILGGEIMSSYPPLSGVTVFVDAKDYDKARELLAEE